MKYFHIHQESNVLLWLSILIMFMWQNNQHSRMSTTNWNYLQNSSLLTELVSMSMNLLLSSTICKKVEKHFPIIPRFIMCARSSYSFKLHSYLQLIFIYNTDAIYPIVPSNFLCQVNDFVRQQRMETHVCFLSFLFNYGLDGRLIIFSCRIYANWKNK